MSQKSVFITGASSGIGFALAIEFSKRGYKVYAGARNVERMEPLRQLGIKTIHLDVTSTESIQAAKKYIYSDNNNTLDILYNNAGISSQSSIFDMTKETLETSFKVNVFGVVEIIQAFKDELLKSKGTIVFTSSVSQHTPTPFRFAYTSSKSSFDHLARTLSLETSKFGLKVVEIVTGAVESNIWDIGSKIPVNSIYYSKDENLLQTLNTPKTSAASYAKEAVDTVEKAIKRNQSFTQLYTGKNSSPAWLIGTFLPFWLYSKIWLRLTKLNEPFQRLADRYFQKKLQ